MNISALIAFSVQIIKRNLIAFAILCIGLVLVIIGSLGWFSHSTASSSETAIPLDAATSSEPTRVISPTSSPEMTIDIEGAVNKPGVYSLPMNSRIADAVSIAQGLSITADKTKISQAINLSAKLTDSMKIYIPAIGDPATVVLGTSTTSSGDSDASNGVVNINTASESDLENLPGVGPVTAQKIIDNRPYATVNDLQAKKVVKSNVYTEIQGKVSVE